MLAQNVSVDVLLADGEVLGQAGAEPGGVQNGAGADDPVGGQAGDLAEHVGQDVHRVADQDVDGVGSMADDVGGDALEDVDVGLGQIDAALAGLPGDAGGDDDHVGAFRVAVTAGVDLGLGGEGGGLPDVHGLAQSLLGVDVDEDDLRGNAVDRQGVGDGGANASCADDGDFVCHNTFSNL